MVKELAIIANVISSAYFMGGMLLQHQKAQELVERMEIGFKGLLLEIKEKKPAEAIQMLLKIFGTITVTAFLALLLNGFLRFHSEQLVSALSITFLIGGILSGSLLWVVKHKYVLKQVSEWLLFLGGGSLLLPVMDILSNMGITNVVYSMMQFNFAPVLELPDGKGLLYEALVVSGVYAGFVLVFYVIAWLYAAPTAMAAWLIVATPIYGARVINRTFPQQPIAIIFFALWLFSFLYLSYASPS